MIPRFRPLIGMRELASIARFGTTDAVSKYERAFAAAVGQAEAVAFPYGRTALRLYLELLELRDAEVICPAYTCVVVPHAIVASGNRPVFVDSRGDASMDLDKAEEAIGPNTRVLVATSLFGHPVDLDRLDALRRRHPDVVVVQDCAHSFACEWSGRSVQAAGDVAIYGCNISKIATSIFGGLLTTDDADQAARLRAFRDARLHPATLGKVVQRALYLAAASLAFTPALYGLVDLLRATGALKGFEDYYDPDRIDMPVDHLSALTALEARVGTVQAARLREFIEARRRMAKAYRAGLGDLSALRFIPVAEGASFSHVAAVVADPVGLVRAARQRGIEIGRVIDYSCPEMRCYDAMTHGRAFPVAAFLSRHVINLPLWGRFDERIAERTVALLRGLPAGAGPAPAIPEPMT